MKKICLMLALAVIVGLSSCTKIVSNAYVNTVETGIYNRSAADLVVSEKMVSYTLNCTGAQSRAGVNSCKAAAVQACLQNNGGGDILVNPQFEVKTTRHLFGKNVNYVKVTGRIGRYQSVHPISTEEAEIVNSLKVKK